MKFVINFIKPLKISIYAGFTVLFESRRLRYTKIAEGAVAKVDK